MRRRTKWLIGGLAALIGLPVVLVGGVLAFANTGIGRRTIMSITESLSGGIVRLEALSGRFPDSLRVGRVQVADEQGVYLTIEGLALNWSPTRLLAAEAAVDSVTADRLRFDRLPASSTADSGSGSNFALPVRVSIGRLQVARAEIGEAVAGHAAALAIDGTGSAESLQQGQATLTVTALGPHPDRYTIDARLTHDRLEASLSVREQPSGLLSGLASLPELGAIEANATLAGPLTALATRLSLSAGPLQATLTGMLDAEQVRGDLAVSASAPAMSPRPDLSWQSVRLDGTVSGPLTAPEGRGTLNIDGLAASGIAARSIRADFTGNAGQASVQGRIDGLRLPGPAPGLFADNPVELDVSARLDQPERPLRFALRHALLSATGTAETGGAPSADLTLTVPDLAPFATLGGADLAGGTRLTIKASQSGETIEAAVTGTVGISGGMAPAPALIGENGTIDVAITMVGNDITLHKAAVTGRGITVSAEGGLIGNVLALDWTTRLADLATVQPSVSGPLTATGHIGGPLDDLALTAELQGDLAAQGYRSGHFTVRVDAAGLPAAPHGKVAADGTLLDAPVALSAVAERRDDGALHVVIDRSTWKSLAVEGALTLPAGAVIPTGTVSLEMRRLDDLTPLLGRPIAGRLKADLNVDAERAKLNAEVREMRLQGTASLAALRLALEAHDPLGQPRLDGTITLEGARAGGIAAKGRATAKGTLDALSLDVSSQIDGVAGATARVATAGVLNSSGKALSLNRLQADWKQQTVRLLAPVRIGFADDITIDRLRLGIRQAELSASGRVGATLDLTAALRNLPVDIAAIIDPAYAADGTVSAEARLTGTPARPQGTVRMTANRLHLRKAPGQALPPATITANADLAGDRATIDTRATMGRSHLTVTGTAPLSAAGALDLRAQGTIDLAMTDPLLSPQGRRARGTVELNAGVAGPLSAPRVAGTVQLANGEIQDFAMGARISSISAMIQGDGDTIRITQFSARAGQGTIDASGTLDLTDSMPVSLHLRANNARPLSSDLLTAVLNADLTLGGAVLDGLNLGGTVTVQRADIRIPERLPTSIATIPVRIAGTSTPPPLPPRPAPPIGLNLTLNAPEQIFIRGRGVDAELGGRIAFTGTAANPVPAGGLTLRRGTFSLAGQVLNFTEGTIDFTGGGLTNPSLRLVAASVSPTLTARLTLSGSARDPKITLSSEPELPQDEILAQLLFNTTSARLSPFQLAQIASALTAMSGGPSLIESPLDDVRNALGLDRLTVGTGANGQPTLEAGSYLARGVYLGARQSASGGGTQATIQVDIARGVKLEATAGAGSTSATGSAGATDAASIGVTYQLEY